MGGITSYQNKVESRGGRWHLYLLEEVRRTMSRQAWEANQKTKSVPDADFGGLKKVSFSFFLMVSL